MKETADVAGEAQPVRSHVLIHLSPTWLRVAQIRPGEGRSGTIEFERAVGERAWSDGLRSLDETLAEALADVTCHGADAVVIFDSPTAVVDLHQAPVTGHDAVQAAQLALRDAAQNRDASDPASFLILGRDHAGSPRQTHVLGVIDEASTAQTVIDFVERAGLRCRGVIPASASMIAASVMDALEDSDPNTLVRLRIEETSAALAASQHGRVLMHRRIDFGVDRMIEALTRPILKDHHEFALTDAQARALLYRVGVPEVEDVIDEARGLTGADILPIIQPVLQRLVVEVKQSLRFSLDEEQRRGISLCLTGAGAMIGRLAEIIASEADAPLGSTSGDGLGPQDAPAARASVAERLALLPAAALKARLHHRIRRGMLAGAALAGALLAADAGWSVWITHSMDQHIASLQDVAQRIGATREQHSTVEQDFIMARLAAAAAPGAMPPRAHWAAWLADLSRRTPTKVRLTAISGAHEPGAAHVTMHGVVAGTDSESSRDIITTFVGSLRDSPLITDVKLRGIRRSEDGAGAQEFDLDVYLATAPAAPPAEERLP